jgi:hypothetical protein
MATAALEISYLDPVIPDKKGYFFQPGQIGLKICEKGSGIGLSLFHFMMSHENAPYPMMEWKFFQRIGKLYFIKPQSANESF